MRQPSAFVRQLSPAEGAQLKRIARTVCAIAALLLTFTACAREPENLR